jgi:Fe-S oxidoreductase
MATYKAEFLHHHYEGRRRPAAHRTMGRLPAWLRLVDRTGTAPLLNSLASVRPFAALAKRLGGIAPEREIPRLAPETFSRWWGRRFKDRVRRMMREGAYGPEVELDEPPRKVAILWPDTFTEHLSPSVGQAAVRVLEAAGVDVMLPPTVVMRKRTPRAGESVSLSHHPWSVGARGHVCCGLTYVSTGQLDRARAVMRRTLDLMGVFLDPDVHPRPPTVVVLEPSCAAALRTDLPELLHDDPRAARLAAAVLTFAEALERLAPDWSPPLLDRPVTGQTHCHQHAVLGDGADRRLREAAGLTGSLAGGCCGLAGNFGFEKGHYEVSKTCAEEQLLPAVRAAAPDTLLLADGFSCRTQLEQLAGRKGRHLAEALAEALDQGVD